MKKKDISQLVPDLKRGLMRATEVAASEIVLDLKMDGPYWTGQFEESWVVNRGQVAVPAVKSDGVNRGTNTYDGVNIDTPKNKVITPVDVPKARDLSGYMIGNEMEYRDAAMDLVDSSYRVNEETMTAERDWFVRYAKAGPMTETLRRSVDLSMKAEGF